MHVLQARALTKVLEIERSSFPEPWSRDMFEYIFRKPTSDFMVAQQNGEVVGYIISIVERRLNFRNLERVKIGHILNLAVDEKHRRQGIGSMLAQSILEKLRERKVSKIYLEVRKSSLAAVRLYSKFNFKVERIIKAYYQGNEDAYFMCKDLNICS